MNNKYYKAVSFVEQLCNNIRTMTIFVNSDTKMIAEENTGFAGGWYVKTMSGQEIGYFQNLSDIELFINN